MMEDPYKVLGVERTASDAAIRSAYRKLAKTHHPDVNPGKPAAAERFKEISAAYALLSEPDKRARFDRGEIDASGADRPQERGYYRDYGETAEREKYRADASFSAEDIEDLFAHAFNRRSRAGAPIRGEDLRYTLTVDFLDAALGSKRRLTLPDGRALDVTIPAGLQDGQVLRLRGKGGRSPGGASAGDALIEVTVVSDKLFRREGNDVIVELPVSLKEAVLGAKVPVPTIQGPVTLTIPPNSSSGTRMRLKGRGIAGGHQYVDLKIVLPPSPEPELAEFLEKWQPKTAFDPRKGMA